MKPSVDLLKSLGCYGVGCWDAGSCRQGALVRGSDALIAGGVEKFHEEDSTQPHRGHTPTAQR
jgi:hypothetical protein